MLAELLRLAREAYELVLADRERRRAERVRLDLIRMREAAERVEAMIADFRRRGLWPE